MANTRHFGLLGVGDLPSMPPPCVGGGSVPLPGGLHSPIPPPSNLTFRGTHVPSSLLR